MADRGSSTPGTRRVAVAAVDDIPPGHVRILEVDDRSIGVFNVAGEYHALANRCPHAGAPVCRGSVGGMSRAVRPGGDVEWTREGQILRCPWHGWEFEIATGRTITEPAKRIPSYRVIVEDGMLVVELKRSRRVADGDR